MTPEPVARTARAPTKVRQKRLAGWRSWPKTQADLFAAAPRARRRRNNREEYEHQAALFVWVERVGLRLCPDLVLLHASAAGEPRSLAIARKLQLMGVRAGFPDLHWPIARGGYLSMYVEMKSSVGQLSVPQRTVFPLLEAQGNHVVVCRTWEQARDLLLAYWRGEIVREAA